MTGEGSDSPPPLKSKVKDLSGLTFGRLTALRVGERRGRRTYWVCACSCGNETLVRSDGLTTGHTLSCGCLRIEAMAQNSTHGCSSHPLSKVWSQMMQRCYNPKSVDYEDYGGRGISVCDRWHDPRNFIRDVGCRPHGTTLDRIDNDKGYGPENFRWATPVEQANNKRTTLRFDVFGESLTIRDMANRLGVPYHVIRMRISRGVSPETAMTQPMRNYPWKSKGTRADQRDK